MSDISGKRIAQDARQDVLDPQTHNAGVHVLAYEKGMPVLIATRLKV